MIKRKLSIALVVGALLAVSAIAYAMSDKNATSGSWRYKMTVTVETPEGLKSGSAVREVIFKLRNSRNPQTVPDITVKGEAVVVDLGKRGVLFALMKGGRRGEDYGDSIVYDAFPLPDDQAGYLIQYYSHLKNAKKVLTETDYPVLVAFSDIKDPASVKPLLDMEPYEKDIGPALVTHYKIKNDHFVKMFGDGIKLHSIEVEMTDEPVTLGVVDRYLPPFGGQPRIFDRGTYSREE